NPKPPALRSTPIQDCRKRPFPAIQAKQPNGKCWPDPDWQLWSVRREQAAICARERESQFGAVCKLSNIKAAKLPAAGVRTRGRPRAGKWLDCGRSRNCRAALTGNALGVSLFLLASGRNLGDEFNQQSLQ